MTESRKKESTSNAAREALIGEVLNEFLDRKAAGEAVNEGELLAEHPELAAELQAHIELLGEIEPTRIAIGELIEKGILTEPTDGRFPARLGPYNIIGPVGRGGMGIVLKAYDESLQRPVAIKLLRPELSHNRTALGRFAREAKAAAALLHPNIITVHAVGEDRGTHYIVMEYIDGPTLAKLIRNEGPLQPGTIRTIFSRVLSGLTAAHNAGLIHRDIKCTNILLAGDEPQVKIADFGLARALTSETRMTMTGSIFGTPEYMSPEQARGDAQIDHRTDLYSAGIVLFEMLTGRAPFKAGTGSAVIHQILHTDPPDPRTIYRAADTHLTLLALRLMARERDDRFASATDVLAALESTDRVSLPAKRRRLVKRVAWSTGCLLLLIGVFAGVWKLSRGSVPSAIAPSPETIAEVRVEPMEDSSSHIVSARYGDSTQWTVFHQFPATVKSVVGAVLLDVDGRNDRVVVAGIHVPPRRRCLFGLNLDRTLRWQLDMSDPAQWPDSGPSGSWRARCLVALNADGKPGEEIIAVAGDPDFYAGRISLIDPKDGAILATFWHPGQLAGLEVLPDFFGPGHPAIFAWGLNNKLDGFGDAPPRPYSPVPGEDIPITKYNIVPVAMILDLRSLNGSAPPRAPQLPVHGVGGAPFTYAYLDLPASGHADFVGPSSSERVRPPREEWTTVCGATEVSCPADVNGPCLQVKIDRTNSSSGALLVVDRDLSPVSAELAGPKEPGITAEWWTRRWRVLVRAVRSPSD